MDRHALLSRDTPRNLLELSAATSRLIRDLDLTGTDLRNTNLDGLILENCNLTGANLNGANLTDMKATNCVFDRADMAYASLNGSRFEGCSFHNAILDHAEIEEATFTACAFSGPSAALLPWSTAHSMANSFYTDAAGTCLPFTCPPVVIGQKTSLVMPIHGNILAGNIYEGFVFIRKDTNRSK